MMTRPDTKWVEYPLFGVQGDVARVFLALCHSTQSYDNDYEASTNGPKSVMAAPLLLRQFLVLRVRLYNYKRFTSGGVAAPHRLWCSTATNQPSYEDEEKVGNLVRAKEASSYPRWDDPDYRKWKDKEKEILSDIEPIILLTKDILHSRRYLDGEQLSVEDEKVVVERLLAYHPHTQDKIGSGLDSIMVDRHPQFRHSRCLFVVRTDGGWIDFSYQKCLREYIRYKYPTHAERFIREYFKRGSG